LRFIKNYNDRNPPISQRITLRPRSFRL
jgi:hypothetical protein